MEWTKSSRGGPFLEISIQPQSKIRFRYKSEMTGKHGSLLGVGPVLTSFHPSEKNSATFHGFQTNLLLNNLNTPGKTFSGASGSETGQVNNLSKTIVNDSSRSENTNVTPSRSIDLSTKSSTGISMSMNNNTDNISLSVNDPFTGTSGNSKIFPTVKLHNYAGEAIIRCSLVNEAPPHYPHPHVLEAGQILGIDQNPRNGNESMSSCRCIEIPVSSECSHTAVFQGLNIIYTGKKGMKKELAIKLAQLEDDDERKIGIEEIESCMLNANLNVVCLYFEAFSKNDTSNLSLNSSNKLIRICRPIISQPIQHNKSTQTGDLRIVRIDKHTSYCTGDEEVFILVEKVDKHNIQVKFFQESDHGSEIWKAYGKFSKLDVHHQYAIVFKTPPYRSCDIDSEVDVWLQLERPSDAATSQPIRFKYKPIERLRKMPKRQSSRNQPSSSGGKGRSEYEQQQQGNVQNVQTSPSQGNGESPSSGSSSSNSQSVRGSLQKFPCDMSHLNLNEYTKTATSHNNVAFTAALSVGEGLHNWAETSDFNFLLHKLRHLLCLVDDNGDNALHAAISNKQHEPFLRILDIVTSSPDVSSALNEQNINNETPVTLAVGADCPEFVKELTERNADLTIPNIDGDNAFHIAVKTNNIPCLRALLRSNKVSSIINRFNYSSMTPLHISVANGYLEATDMVCRAGANLTVQEGTFGRTPLHLAVEKGSITASMLLIQAAREGELAEVVNIQNYRGDTPLHVASSSGLVAICAILLYYGADPTIENYMKKEETEGELDEINVGQSAVDAAANEEILKTINGDMKSWEKIVKACSQLLDSRAEKNPKVFSLDSLQIDSGIDIKDQATYSYSK